MGNLRETKHKIKVVLFLIALVVAVAYFSDQLSGIPKEKTKSKFRGNARLHQANKAYDKTVSRNLWNRISNTESNKRNKQREYESPYTLPEMKLNWFDDVARENADNKDDKESNIIENGVKDQLNKTENKSSPRVSEQPVKRLTNRTSPRPKITFNTVIKIVREVLDHMNISQSNTTVVRKFNQTNQLSQSTVGNISKEILKKNLSLALANAVISVLTSGGKGSPQNKTLRKQLMKGYINNTKPIYYSPQMNPPQKGQYMDKYQRLNANKQPMMSPSHPEKGKSNQGYRQNSQMIPSRDNQQQPVVRKNQFGFKDQLQQPYKGVGKISNNLKPNQGYSNKVNQPKQGYKGNIPNAKDRQKFPYTVNVQPSVPFKENLQPAENRQRPRYVDNVQQPQVYKGNLRPVGESKKPRYVDNVQQPQGYKGKLAFAGDSQKSIYRDNVQP